MTPGARVQAAIDLMGRIAAFAEPADRIVAEYVRGRRYIGSKDRRAITDRVFAILRGLARLDWWWAHAGGANASEAADAAGRGGEPRARVLAALALLDGLDAESVAALCDGRTYHPGALDADEYGRLDLLAGQPLATTDQPNWVRVETPAWLLPALEAGLGGETATELAALAEPAPVDLRVNTLRGDTRTDARSALDEAGIQAEPTPYAPLGLRVAGRRNVTNSAPFKAGRVEIQDEAAQLAAALVGATPDMAVCDLCAGAGGKTLALAAAMRDGGRLVALDRDDGRLAAATPRLRRAGVHNVERRMLAGPDDPWLADNRGAFDRVLVDAPCSGTGTWRRQPDSRWRLSAAALDARVREQRETLGQAADLVRPGGRLVYVTCSLVAAENGERITDLCERFPAFAPVPIGDVWTETIGSAPPCAPTARALTLTPARHGTDGFYIAVLERARGAS
jgi:16S rRNA (cytosine967-C5)-methyltransferase